MFGNSDIVCVRRIQSCMTFINCVLCCFLSIDDASTSHSLLNDVGFDRLLAACLIAKVMSFCPVLSNHMIYIYI